MVIYIKKMIDNIKSTYFIKYLFSFLDEKVKLEALKYNKKFQKLIDYNLLNYKIFSERYIIYETNQKGKEYDYFRDNILFEGEYLNGKRNGKGKEYNYFGEYILFEGEYLNGKRNGKGKEFKKGKLIFDGEYLNGKRMGKGKEFNENGKIKFEGEYLDGKRWNGKGYDEKNNYTYELINGNGKVKEYYEHYNLTFEGEYVNGEKNGKGIEYYPDGKLGFKGEYLNGEKWNGKILLHDGSLSYEMKNGIQNIIVNNIEEDIIEYEGEALNFQPNGKGKSYNKFGLLKFEGEFLDGLEWKGKGYDTKGNIIYEINNTNNNGKEYYENGSLKYEGEYMKGKRHGKGKSYNEKSILIFEGEDYLGYEKKGKEYYDGKKLKYEGEYLFYDKWNGKGYDEDSNIIYELINGKGKVKEYNNFDCDLIYEGEYLDGKRNGKGKEYNIIID